MTGWKKICCGTLATLCFCALRSPAGDSISLQVADQYGYGGVTKQHVPFEKAYNFRDLGGYQTLDGLQVKRGVLFRADSLAFLSSGDLQLLTSLDLRKIVDFRSQQEQLKHPDKLPDDHGIVVQSLAISPNPQRPDQQHVNQVEEIDLRQFVLDLYRRFPTDYAVQYRTFIQQLADPDNLPLLFHCAAGNDRAGFAASLVLLALGVPEENVVDDYLLSNNLPAAVVEQKSAAYAKEFGISQEKMKSVMVVQEEFLQTAFATIRERYGSIDNYLVKELGVTEQVRQKLRANLLVH